jgi:hypothetical protein
MSNSKSQAGTTADSSTQDEAALSVRRHNTNTMLGAVAMDWKLGNMVNVIWFGKLKTMKIIGHDEPSNQVQVQHLDAMGSFYEKAEYLLKLGNCP